MQVIDGISSDLALKLMHSAFAPANGIYGVQPLVQGLPVHLQAMVLRACTPCIDAHGELDTDVHDSRGEKFVADVLPYLPQIRDGAKLTLGLKLVRNLPRWWRAGLL